MVFHIRLINLLLISGISDKAIDNHAYLNNSNNFQQVNTIEEKIKYRVDTTYDL